MLTRILFWTLVVYLAYRLIKVLVFGPSPRSEQKQVRGKPRNAPLDLSKHNVEEAKFEEIKEPTNGKKQ
jgi:hypothetical protein